MQEGCCIWDQPNGTHAAKVHNQQVLLLLLLLLLLLCGDFAAADELP
jgi:hypothetical protein